MNKAIGYITIVLIIIFAFAFNYDKTPDTTHIDTPIVEYPAEQVDILDSPIAGATETDRKKNYIKRFHKVAQDEQAKYDIPASISIAQGILESSAGTSTLAVQNKNHFGIKCFKRNCPKGHCTNHSDDTHKDFFRKYQNSWESWREHSLFLSGSNYKHLKKSKNYKVWAIGLQEAGYATNKNYAKNLINIIEDYELYKYDK